jgi:hypothetical protein
MSMPALRVALYARVSSDQQTEQGTIASQVAALEARILQDGLPLEPDHRFIDEGHSGATLIRPALEHLRDAVAIGTVDLPALIESDLFAAAQEQLAENRQRNRQTRRGQRYLLQGLLVCRRCGYAYYGKAISLRAAKGKQRDYAYYRCCGSDAHRFGGQRLCANPQLRTDRADAAVWQEVQRLLQHPDMIAAEYERRLHQAQHPDPDRPDLVTAEAQIAKLRRGIDRLIDGYAEGLIEKAEFEQRITGLRQRIKTWEQQAATLQDEAALRRTLSLIIGRLEDFAKQVRQRMDAPDWSLQRDLIRLLVKRVEVDHDEINVVFRVAPPLASLPPGPGQGRSLQDCWRGGNAGSCQSGAGARGFPNHRRGRHRGRGNPGAARRGLGTVQGAACRGRTRAGR